MKVLGKVAALGIVVVFLLSSIFLINSETTSDALTGGGVELGTSAAYEFTQYGTYLFWNSTIYAKSVQGYADQLSFTDGSLDSQNSNSAFSFGIGSEFANATINFINSTAVGVNTGLVVGGVFAFLFFHYNALEKPLLVYMRTEQSLTLLANFSSNFYSNSLTFSKAGAPAAYLNASALSLTIKLDTPSSLLFTFLLLKPSSNWLLIVAVIASIVAVAGGTFVYFRRKRRRQELSTNA